MEWKRARAIKGYCGKNPDWEASLRGETGMDADHGTQAALHFLAEQHIGSRIYISGYSFGSLVGMRVGVEGRNGSCVCLHSMPFGKYNLDFLAPCKNRNLLFTLEMILQRQRKIPYGVFKDITAQTTGINQDSDHFYRMKEGQVSKRCAVFSEHW